MFTHIQKKSLGISNKIKNIPIPRPDETGKVPNISINQLMTKGSVLTLMIVLKGMLALELDKEQGGRAKR